MGDYNLVAINSCEGRSSTGYQISGVSTPAPPQIDTAAGAAVSGCQVSWRTKLSLPCKVATVEAALSRSQVATDFLNIPKFSHKCSLMKCLANGDTVMPTVTEVSQQCCKLCRL